MDQLKRSQTTELCSGTYQTSQKRVCARCNTFKFEFNMADASRSVDGSAARHVAGGDSVCGPLNDGMVAVDGNVNGCACPRPFLIGVAGGTASGKVCVPSQCFSRARVQCGMRGILWRLSNRLCFISAAGDL